MTLHDAVPPLFGSSALPAAVGPRCRPVGRGGPRQRPAESVRARPRLRGLLGGLLGGLLVLGLGGCKDLTGNPGLPAGTPNPAVYNTPTGAVGMYTAAFQQFAVALPQYVLDAGLLTDELHDGQTGASTGHLLLNGGAVTDPLDERILPSGVTVASYGQLQGVRTLANQAIGALATYDTGAATLGSANALRGELYALEGYAEIMLADLFCSGVPLSTLDFQKDFTYHAGASTSAVYQDARAKFDTALALGSTSDSVTNLALVGLGRVLVDLGQYAAAGDDVSAVPTGFSFPVPINWSLTSWNLGTSSGGNEYNITPGVSDREGQNGLPFISSGDPRTAETVGCVPNPLASYVCADTLFFPVKYGNFNPVTLASGIEARLIQAEAALQAGDAPTWLVDLNALRTTGQATVTTSPTLTDTLYETGCPGACVTQRLGPPYLLQDSTVISVASGSPAFNQCYQGTPYSAATCENLSVMVYGGSQVSYGVGTGGVANLPLLTDPVDPVARVDTLFTERAFWLFLDGHRQGDLRRLLRQYGGVYAQFNSQARVYPTGPYLAPGTGLYGTDVVAPIPLAEYANPLFQGCIL